MLDPVILITLLLLPVIAFLLGAFALSLIETIRLSNYLPCAYAPSASTPIRLSDGH